jgi:CTD kinase subunit beta
MDVNKMPLGRPNRLQLRDERQRQARDTPMEDAPAPVPEKEMPEAPAPAKEEPTPKLRFVDTLPEKADKLPKEAVAPVPAKPSTEGFTAAELMARSGKKWKRVGEPIKPANDEPKPTSEVEEKVAASAPDQPSPAADPSPPRSVPRVEASSTTCIDDDLDKALEKVGSHTLNTPPQSQAPLGFLIKGAAARMGAKRTADGEPKRIGPHPGTIKVAHQYSSQAFLDKVLYQHVGDNTQERSLAEAREDHLRLQGVTWIDQVRRALQLPIRTYTTACTYFHLLRLDHPTTDYSVENAAAASLLLACKTEDTLKKGREILAAAYNTLKASGQDPLSPDDPIFNSQSNAVVFMEKLVLQAIRFKFTSKDQHQLLVRIIKSLPQAANKAAVGNDAYTVLTDLSRTFALLKQTSPTLAIAALELAARIHADVTRSTELLGLVQAIDLDKWSISRDMVMETLLDALDLYTHHSPSTVLGPHFTLDNFLRIRLALNQECSDHNLPRYAKKPESAANGSTLRAANGHPTPVSPPDPTQAAQQTTAAQNNMPPVPEGGGTYRYMLNPQLAADEKAQVRTYYDEVWEEYEEVINVPLPKPPPSQPQQQRRASPLAQGSGPVLGPVHRSSGLVERRSIDEMREVRAREEMRDRERERERREREYERSRMRDRDYRDRDRRYGGYDDRRRDRR